MTEQSPIDWNACATVSLAEAARVIGIHRTTAWDLYKRGTFPMPVLEVGHRLRVAKHHVHKYLFPDEGPAPDPDVPEE